MGVDPSTGDIVYKDVNIDGEITSADRTKVGNPHPDFIAGLTNTFTYKGFDLSIFFQASYGNDVFNGSRLYLESLGAATISWPLFSTDGKIRRHHSNSGCDE
ncbi:MAG: hypothetical protein IPL69_20910 [Saprospiraceae bacterium]|nr:hypothetical protein [Candidatus Brachybacter algidus]